MARFPLRRFSPCAMVRAPPLQWALAQNPHEPESGPFGSSDSPPDLPTQKGWLTIAARARSHQSNHRDSEGLLLPLPPLDPFYRRSVARAYGFRRATPCFPAGRRFTNPRPRPDARRRDPRRARGSSEPRGGGAPRSSKYRDFLRSAVDIPAAGPRFPDDFCRSEQCADRAGPALAFGLDLGRLSRSWRTPAR